MQNSPLFSGTIRDNIVYGRKGEVSEEEIIQAAKAANAYDFIMEFPEGFDKEVGEGGMRLSGGQRQRIAIARAMIVNPKILLMDEATASLDYQSDKLIWQACESLMKGRTTILIAHDMNAVTSADNIVVMNHGNIEAVGTNEEVMQTSPVYNEYIRLQQQRRAQQFDKRMFDKEEQRSEELAKAIVTQADVELLLEDDEIKKTEDEEEKKNG